MVKKAKWLYLAAGCLLVALATLGIFLPLLPTTPLLLLAWCFAQSSEKCHRWLMEHRVFGPIIKNYHENRCIPAKAKCIAVATILVFGTWAIGFRIEQVYVRVIGAALCLTGLIFVLRVPTCPRPTPRP